MLIFKTLGLGALQVEVARRALLRVARGPVLGLAGLAAVAALAAGARGQRRVARVGLETANVTCSPIPLPSFTAYWPVALPIRSLPIRSLTFDTTIALVAASATDSESRRVEGKLARTALGVRTVFQRGQVADRVRERDESIATSIIIKMQCHLTMVRRVSAPFRQVTAGLAPLLALRRGVITLRDGLDGWEFASSLARGRPPFGARRPAAAPAFGLAFWHAVYYLY